MGSILSTFFIPSSQMLDVSAMVSVLEGAGFDRMPQLHTSDLSASGDILGSSCSSTGVLRAIPNALVQTSFASPDFTLELCVGSLQWPPLVSATVNVRSLRRLGSEKRVKFDEMVVAAASAMGAWAAVSVLDPADDFLGRVLEADGDWFFEMELENGPAYDPAVAWVLQSAKNRLHMRNLLATGRRIELYQEFVEVE